MSKRARFSGKRAYLKKFNAEYVKVPQKVDFNKIKTELSAYDDYSFLQAMPKTIGMVQKRVDPELIPRTLVNNRIQEFKEIEKVVVPWQSDRFKGLDVFSTHIVIHKDDACVVKLFMSGAKYCIIKEYQTKKFASKIYRSRGEAMSSYELNRIIWKTII